MKEPLNQTWDLETFFAGGSDSESFQKFIADIEDHIAAFRELMGQEKSDLLSSVELMQKIRMELLEASSFTGCLMAENMNDLKAVQLSNKITALYAQFEGVQTLLADTLLKMEEAELDQWIKDNKMDNISFALHEIRTVAKKKLPAEQEALIEALAVDGYHGWSSNYDTVVSQLKFPFEEDGEVKELSAGQAYNKLSSKDRDVREKMFKTWEEGWGNAAQNCADALNHIAGFRLQTYAHRKWDDVLQEPLGINRMSEKTLQTMWSVIEENKKKFIPYFEKKAQLLGVDTLSWHDVEAPVGKLSKTYGYDEAAQLIVKQFEGISPKMAEFAAMSFENNWIEVEDRGGKRPGGFCTPFPVSEETRVFMTFEGTASNVSTLAHELGHAYHEYAMKGMPNLARDYAMNVAETASTFAEMIVSDAAIEAAQSSDEKLFLLDDKIQRSIAFYMNIHARFLFETRFYEERKNGTVSVERLNELMVTAQKDAYLDQLGDYHPHFWASKLHFYITSYPFYNFPYTFGYLFSAGIYARAAEKGTSFEDDYIALLQDTASMKVEDLASKHLGVDLTKPDFWQSALDISLDDVDQFLKL
ncbi:M3 family oligoendopeptidase [Longirhabdus pacifica]|uniref:M3 family oligoendopeptidase n=1 Tax=Longirhabdus pacifica TaxID=2305227 RepID=UPI0010092D4B|nr:M3 family oligoendopeptidase [Longirhabdus pacifica]